MEEKLMKNLKINLDKKNKLKNKKNDD